MGVGNLSRRVGMNRSTRSDRRTLNEAAATAEDQSVQATKRPEKPERSEAQVTDVTGEIASLVEEFAEVEAEIAAATARRNALKERAIALGKEHGVDDFTGPQGKVQVIQKKPTTTFDKKRAKTLLGEAKFNSCLGTGKTPAPSVKFVPTKK